MLPKSKIRGNSDVPIFATACDFLQVDNDWYVLKNINLKYYFGTDSIV